MTEGVSWVGEGLFYSPLFCAGTPPYMAPELFLSYMSRGGAQNQSGVGYVMCCISGQLLYQCGCHVCRYDGKCDVWSIGCILWDMANNVDIFISVSQLSHFFLLLFHLQ